MSLLLSFLICFIAGAGAGLGTGFAGMSAAAIISPVLITFLGVPAYEAVGIALASDVLASGVSSITYAKHKNVDIRNGLVMMIAVLTFTLVGSLVSSFLPSTTMGSFSVIMTMVLGIKFLIKPVTGSPEAMSNLDPKARIIRSVLSGTLVGFICGFIGAGGGMMMLIILTAILGYELKMAVGTSVFIMTFTALTGALSHFVIGGIPNLFYLAVCVFSTLIWARIAAKIANKVDHITLNRITGSILVTFGLAVLFLG
ncbi:sulfite exporter TauE/SafE family protein [Eubacteriaceae bacterium ES3]|nr:sulfite exporter TauE/SafE family protein [Eubacteriaceae bacterium ES3]